MYRGLEFLRNIKDCVNANLSLLNTGKEIILYDKLTTSNKHKSLEEWAMEFNGDLMLDGEYDWGRTGWKRKNIIRAKFSIQCNIKVASSA